jgi:hypothetical protein
MVILSTFETRARVLLNTAEARCTLIATTIFWQFRIWKHVFRARESVAGVLGAAVPLAAIRLAANPSGEQVETLAAIHLSASAFLDTTLI